MDHQLNEDAAGRPHELVGMPGAQLPEQLVLAARERAHEIARVHAIGADELDVAHRAVANLLDQGLAGRGMPGHETGADLEVLLLGSFARPQDAFDAARVGREILFHEHVDALLDGILQVRRAESGVGGQHRHVARAQAINGVPIGVEAQELPLGRHVDKVAQRLLQHGVGLINLVLADISHGNQFDRPAGARADRPLGATVIAQDQPAGRHGIGHRAAAPSTAADQGQVDGVVGCRMNVRNGHPRQGRGGGELAGGFDEFATRGKLISVGLHGRHARRAGESVSSIKRCAPNPNSEGRRPKEIRRSNSEPDAISTE